jgi:hypothetical protein
MALPIDCSFVLFLHIVKWKLFFAEAHNLCTRRVDSSFLWSCFFACPIHGGCLQSQQMSFPYFSAAAKSNLNHHDQTASKCTIILNLSINAFVKIMPLAIHKWVRTNRIEIFGYEYMNRETYIIHTHKCIYIWFVFRPNFHTILKILRWWKLVSRQWLGCVVLSLYHNHKLVH